MLRRNNAGRYQVYLVDILIDNCATKKHLDGGNEVIKRVLAVYLEHSPALRNGCPLNVSVLIKF